MDAIDALPIPDPLSPDLDLADEQESYRRYQLAECEMLDALDSDELDDATRKRRMMRVFDRFRYEYAQLSTLLREHVRAQRRIMGKCVEIKNELVLAALKVTTHQRVQDEEMKNLVFYRDECEIAWRERAVCEERERDAMRIIDDLKCEIDALQLQVKALVADALPPAASTTAPANASERGATTGKLHSSTAAGALGSPAKTVAALKKHSNSSNSRAVASLSATPPSSAPSFDDWKRATRVWDPHAAPIAPRSPTPSLESLRVLERRQEIARCVSVPSLQPTALERATTAVLTSPTRQSRKPQTGVGFMRATTAPTPSTTALSPTRRTIAPLPHV